MFCGVDNAYFDGGGRLMGGLRSVGFDGVVEWIEIWLREVLELGSWILDLESWIWDLCS